MRDSNIASERDQEHRQRVPSVCFGMPLACIARLSCRVDSGRTESDSKLRKPSYVDLGKYVAYDKHCLGGSHSII